MQEQINSSSQSSAAPAIGSSGSDSSVHASRRRFVKVGLITAPLVLTLSSRPASALVGPSVGLSGNVSTFGNNPPPLQGYSVSYWKNPQNFFAWTAPFSPGLSTDVFNAQGQKTGVTYSGGTLFSDVFDNAFPGKSLLDVLGLQGLGLESLGRQTVAALLNGANPGIFYRFGAPHVIKMFNDAYEGQGQFTTSQLEALFETENSRTSG